MHIFDFRWDDTSEKPYFQYIKNNELHSLALPFNEKISLTVVDDEMQCIGKIVNKKWTECKEKIKGVKKCEICKKAEDYFPCQFCNGFNCERFRKDKIENCDADHMVYLALFDENIVKVGVSRLSRMKARQFEQGTHYTRLFIKGVSGVTARRIEHFIGKLGFPDKISASKKKDIIFPEISLENGKKLLDEKFHFAKENLHHQMPEMMKYIVENEFWDMRSYYAENFEALGKLPKPVHYLDLEKGESVGGILRGAKGSFLLIETESEIVVVLAKKLVGKHISFEDCENGITKNGGFQGGLF